MPKLRLGVLASGSGSNLQAIIDNIESGNLPCEIAVVISDKPDAFALKRVERHGIKTEAVQSKTFQNREGFDTELVKILNSYNVDLVVLAGFMRVVTGVLISAFPMRIMNIHPALLPSFPGLHVQEKALEYGAKFSGCTVHFVDEGVDTGPIIIQAVVPVLDDDTEETLSARILKEEHRIYPYAIRLFAEGRLEVKGRRVIVKDHPKDEGAMENPQVLPK
ncbi:MAG: phosphoribosylglycinamide formyltransferase [Deltaproteobacteria bacterium]|nr:phosphoribosylglycinamide formyltransferase [Deltaproteobacteria bacterium]